MVTRLGSARPGSMTQASTHAHNGTGTSLQQQQRLLLGVVRVLLGELSAEGGDLGLKRRHLTLVVLLHACHALLDLADVLPHVGASMTARMLLALPPP